MSYLTTRLLPRVSSLSSSKSRKSNDSLNAPPSPSSISSISQPHVDPLPGSPELLEGRLNHLASQLQIAAKRVETLNEFIDMEAIVLARLVRDEKSRRAEVEAEVMKRDSGKWNQEGDIAASEGKENVDVEPTSEILVERELLIAMKRCKKGMEKSVIWQRDEFRRVEKALGRPKEKIMSDGSDELDIGKELRGSGRLPTQDEWETMFRA